MSSEPAAPVSRVVSVPAARVDNAIRLDGEGRDGVWTQAVALGKCADGEAHGYAVQAGPWLLLRFEVAEREGIVARESTHGAEPWFEDAIGLAWTAPRKGGLWINPFGSMWAHRAWKGTLEPITGGRVVCSAYVGEPAGDGAVRWQVETALRLDEELGVGPEGGTLELSAARQRQPRGLEPFRESKFAPLKLTIAPYKIAEAPRFDLAPPQRFAGRALLFAGQCIELPANEADWARMPVSMLRPEHGGAATDPDYQRTEVRAALDGETLALRVFCREAFPETIDDAGEAMWKEDNVEVFLGAERYGYLQFLTNPKGKVQATNGQTGGRRVRGAPVPEGATVQAALGEGGWTVELRIPLVALHERTGAPASAHPAVYPWRVQVSRTRPAREAIGQASQVSLLAVTRSATAHCPLRYGEIRVVEPGGQAAFEKAASELPAPVLDAEKRKAWASASLNNHWLSTRTTAQKAKLDAAITAADTPEKWKAWAERVRRDLGRAVLGTEDGKIPPHGLLEVRQVYEKQGDGFVVDGVIMRMDRTPVPLTVFRPVEAAADEKRPALIMFPAHHTHRNSQDLQVLGAQIARAGGVAVAYETWGSGERAVSALWEHKNYQRNLLGAQVDATGQSLGGWTVWEMAGVVDYLISRGDVDSARIGLVGGVAGGGDASALCAALEERITVSIPFNFSQQTAMSAWFDAVRCYRGSRTTVVTPWMVNALVAPRQLIQAEEFDWNDSKKAAYADYQKLYGMLEAEKNLAFLHGGPDTHATHFSHVHRPPLYRILNKWWNLKLPETREDEYTKTMKHNHLNCLDHPQGAATLAQWRSEGKIADAHAIAHARAAADLAAARARRAGDADALVADLKTLFKEAPQPGALDQREGGAWRGYAVRAWWLPVDVKDDAEAGRLGLAAWVLQPKNEGAVPAVLGLAQDGKAQFLARRGADVEALLEAGVAVVLADVRGTGETAPGTARFPESEAAHQAEAARALDTSMMAARLADVQALLQAMKADARLDGERIALWGEGLSAPNAAPGEGILFDETGFRQTSPQPRQYVENAGPFLAMVGALLSGKDGPAIRAVLVRGGLDAYLSALERRHHYVPVDAWVPRLLTVADVPDIAQALNARGIRLVAQDLRDGSNRGLSFEAFTKRWGAAAPTSYTPQPGSSAVAELLKTLLP